MCDVYSDMHSVTVTSFRFSQDHRASLWACCRAPGEAMDRPGLEEEAGELHSKDRMHGGHGMV